MIVPGDHDGSLCVAERLDGLQRLGVLGEVQGLVLDSAAGESALGGVALHALRLGVDGDLHGFLLGRWVGEAAAGGERCDEGMATHSVNPSGTRAMPTNWSPLRRAGLNLVTAAPRLASIICPSPV